MSISAGKFWGMKRMADSAGRFKMTAVDQRPPIKKQVAGRSGNYDGVRLTGQADCDVFDAIIIGTAVFINFS